MLSWRALVLATVIILSLALVMPTVRGYLTQQEEVSARRAEVEAARFEVANLEAEVARWGDPAFVIAQARERLSYVLPGETPFRVVDPEVVVVIAAAPDGETPTAYEEDPAWFTTVWGSLQQAGVTAP